MTASPFSDARVLVVGAGGLSCPALEVLVQSGVRRFTLVDDDRVDASNLHRQTLYTEADEGVLKVDAAARALARIAGGPLEIAEVVARFTPARAGALLAGHDVVLEGADNFATKFLVADAAKLHGIPCVQAGCVRWTGWALATVPEFGPCLRCLFEDIPRGAPETCAVAGVVGPVVGAIAALQAALVLGLLRGRERTAGRFFSYEALRGRLRERTVARRVECPLCAGQIQDLALDRYRSDCAA